MRTVSVTNARNDLFNLIKEVAENSEPIQITGKNGNAVLLSEDDWRSIQETLYLLSIPGMKEDLIEGLKTPIEKCSDKLE